MKNYFSVSALVLFSSLLSSCGIKGPLYMPEVPVDPAAVRADRELAVKKEKLLELKDCGIVLDRDDRDLCYDLHDEREKNLRVCELIVDEDNRKLCLQDVLGKAYREDPYLETAKDKCGGIDDENLKKTCLDSISEEKLDEEAIAKCSLVAEDSQREACLANYREEKRKRLEANEALKRLEQERLREQDRSDIQVIKANDANEGQIQSQESLSRDEADLVHRMR